MLLPKKKKKPEEEEEEEKINKENAAKLKKSSTAGGKSDQMDGDFRHNKTASVSVGPCTDNFDYYDELINGPTGP